MHAKQLRVILDILERMSVAYERLANLAQRQKEALVAGDLTAMQAAVAEMQNQLAEVERLERDRQVVTADVARGLGVDAGSLTVSGLADKLDPAAASKLKSTARRLQAAIAELARTNDTNRQLVAQAQMYQQKFTEWLARALATDTYGPYRQRHSGGQLLDIQA
ncbi:MAG: flagellar protein FlgN [Alicyclobacillus herbarius]|uniref:flagellar protein FlgN n=1 Tax=Alicyclobacillus herbarius TaxID=122960 RepID=UPI000478E12A|nr:flagellar protein FlgN [Alicyclobacillus herbarius]MCL6632371.1 flagellar protein FlgN [Alicyclobacillus herbarius]